MKTVILCGGLGTRLSEETVVKPKPMVEIGHKPILWHIMKIYEAHGFREFVLALGYKGEIVKDYFIHYHAQSSDITAHLATGNISYQNPAAEDWLVHMIETGRDTLTGGRLHRLERVLRPEGTFMLTYGDGLANVDVTKLVAFHRSHGKLATVTAVRPPARFGDIVFDGNRVIEFKEKPQTGGGWINGGFFVFEPEVFDFLHGDTTVLEKDPLEKLAAAGQLMSYKHEGFWHCMDTVRDRNALEEFWQSASPPWKVWK
ncbi:MAG TPA: glucose-1-phosphate cytidylyltransferase [Candidatus Ozemobacteraceae bacterium]